MKKWVSTACLLSACQVIPGTAANTVREGEKIAADEVADPPAAKFRNSRVAGNVVCGEINGKNGYGAYVGFTPFSVEVDRRQAAFGLDNVAKACLTAKELAAREEQQRIRAAADMLADNLEMQADNLEAMADDAVQR